MNIKTILPNNLRSFLFKVSFSYKDPSIFSDRHFYTWHFNIVANHYNLPTFHVITQIDLFHFMHDFSVCHFSFTHIFASVLHQTKAIWYCLFIVISAEQYHQTHFVLIILLFGLCSGRLWKCNVLMNNY